MTPVLRTTRSALLCLALLAPALLGATAATAAAPAPLVHDALGDSYASGYGVPPYEAGNRCGRSRSAPGVLIDGRMRIALDDYVACAGATTATLVSGGQLEALDVHTDLVTISIGGNDIGWSTAVQACLGLADDACRTATDFVRGLITTALPGLLDGVYDQIAARAPHATVVVMGYPRLFSPEYGAVFLASPAEQQALNDGADLLNSVIAQAAEEHGFVFVDVTKRFLDHGVNAPEPWLLGPLDPGAFHPNAAGYEAYAAAVTAAIRPGRLR